MNNEQIITAYAYLTCARIYKDLGKWILDTPGYESPQFDTLKDLIEYICEDIGYIKENIDPELWEAAETYATR